jgi:hypothetical protein
LVIAKNSWARCARVRYFETVKTTWAIICSLVLVFAPLIVAPTSVAACVTQAVDACCQKDVAMPCCQAAPASQASRDSTVPAPAPAQPQHLAPALLSILWLLPEGAANSISSHATPAFSVIDLPLRTRYCTLLI